MVRIYEHKEFYKKVDKVGEGIQEHTKKAMRDMADAEDPAALGVRKCAIVGDRKA